MEGQVSNRVLLVDDNPLLLKLISRYLLAAGYVVRTAEDGLDALGKLRAGLPDLIISDLNMPRMSGIEFLGVVRKRFPQIPIVIITGEPLDTLPTEFAPDAVYHKNDFGFEKLPQTIAELAGKIPRRDTCTPIDNEPALARRDGDGRYTITCRDCLREFSASQVFHVRLGESWVTCIHCGKMLRFLVAEASEDN